MAYKKPVNELGFNYTPTQYGSGPNIPTAYASALQRWLNQQKESTKQFGRAEQPLGQMVNLFQPGGGYGAGQNALIEDEARRAKAEALSDMVSSGMSSGSLATSTGLRIGSDVTKAKLGVQDTRTQFLADALAKLSGLRGTYASQVGTNAEPFTNQFMGSLQNLAGGNYNTLQPAFPKIPREPYNPESASSTPWATLKF